MAIAAIRNWPLYHMNVHNAFLQGDLDEETYMTIPQGFSDQEETKVCRVLKSVYGLRQASRQWNTKLTESLIAAGFTQSKSDNSLFTKEENANHSFLYMPMIS